MFIQPYLEIVCNINRAINVIPDMYRITKRFSNLQELFICDKSFENSQYLQKIDNFKNKSVHHHTFKFKMFKFGYFCDLQMLF